MSVIRNGDSLEISEDEILTGDIIKVSAGMKIPCDGYLIQGELIVDESAMTGETNTAKKETLSNSQANKNTTPIVISGTVILDGEAKILTLLVGSASCVGKISVPVEEPEETIMQRKISDFSIYLENFQLRLLFCSFYILEWASLLKDLQKAILRRRFI